MSSHNTTIFISYRRKESVLHTLLLHSRLQQQFAGQVFMDQQELLPGENFRHRIETQLQGCRVMLAVIGPNWSKVADDQGQPRLHAARDWVRLEITTALKRGISVIPVLIDGARMPDEADLPGDLHSLLDVQALVLDHERYFEQGVGLLVSALQRCLAAAPIELKNIPARPWAKAYGTDEFQTPWADLEIGGVTQRLRWIEPGSFLMGCDPLDPNGHESEKPQHRVALTRGFWLADTTCTQALWRAVTANNPSFFKWDADLPVENVSWEDVKNIFLTRVSGFLNGFMADLPTEAEWEYACRAGVQLPYSFGTQVSSGYVNCNQPDGRTVRVKALLANAWGLYQMHGNVWEWCKDVPRIYLNNEELDPQLDPKDRFRGLRGGAWDLESSFCRSATRNVTDERRKNAKVGFRFVLRPIKMG